MNALARAGITTADEVLTESRTAVCTKGRITEEMYQNLLQHASMPFLPLMFAASEWREQQSVRLHDRFFRQVRDPEADSQARLSFGSAEIDAFLHGGLRPFGITEVAGEAGAGKSQICMQLCANVQLPVSLGGLGGGMHSMELFVSVLTLHSRSVHLYGGRLSTAPVRTDRFGAEAAALRDGRARLPVARGH